MILVLAISVPVAYGQSTYPLSLPQTAGVHVFVYDNLEHKSTEYYNALFSVVLKEFGVPTDTIPSVDLIFIDQDLRGVLNGNNARRFGSADWCGAFIKPSLIIMLGEEESDDTFMHECMHYLQQQGRLFQDVHSAAVHQMIDRNEGLLLGSKSYLEFLKKKPN